MNNLIKCIKQKLNNQKFILACSTGADSMCLLDLILKANLKDNMIIAHVNHGVREESKTEEEFLVNYCKQNNIQLELTHIICSSSNFENDARIKRYNFFKDIMDKYQCNYLLLAHNADDNLETIIMRLLKSSSLKAYSGIEKECKFHTGYIYRPLLEKSKNEIINYNKNNDVVYFDDVTNFTDEHLRNRIRKNITPVLLKENPNLYEAVTYYSETHFACAHHIENEVNDFFKTYVDYSNNDYKIYLKDLLKLDDYLLKEVIFTLLKNEDLSYRQLDQLLSDIKSNNPFVCYKLKELSFIKEHEYILFTKQSIVKEMLNITISKEGNYILTNNSTLLVKDGVICFKDCKDNKICYNNISVPFVVRNINDGDKIKRISKEKEYNQKINNILTTKKISYLDKINTLVIDKDNEIKCILGLKIK